MVYYPTVDSVFFAACEQLWASGKALVIYRLFLFIFNNLILRYCVMKNVKCWGDSVR